MDAPLAYHITWTTYGVWLPGDERGWVDSGVVGIQQADSQREADCQVRQRESAIVLSDSQREIVEQTIRDHCRIRNWELHALNVRSNHIHIVVTADRHPDDVMNQLKAWCSRKLSDHACLTEKRAKGAGRRKWFTEHGSTKWIWKPDYLENAIQYVTEGQ